MFKKYFSKSSDIDCLSEEEEEILEKNLVWIFADRRSGTTWLGMELMSHNTKYVDEPLIGLHLGYFEPDKKKGVQLTSELHQNREDYFFADKFKDTWRFYLRKLILNRIYAQFHDLSSKIILKEPSGSFASEMIAKCLPKSKIIILLRDGRDVLDSKIDSKQKGGWATNTGHPEINDEKRKAFIKSRSFYWIKMMELVMKSYENHEKSLRYKTKYEELLENTSEELKKIYEFIGVKISENELNEIISKFSFEKIPNKEKGSGKFRRFAKPGLWKENFSNEEVELIEKIMGETLQKIGY